MVKKRCDIFRTSKRDKLILIIISIITQMEIYPLNKFVSIKKGGRVI